LFNQPHPARAAVPWQPNAGIAKKLSSRGYATTSWTTDEPEAFADLGYPAKSSGFSADHYQPMRQPLSKQAQASLALLEGEYRNESFGEEKPASQPSSATNEHLPFVMDHYGASRKSKLRVNVDPNVLKRAMDHAELAETLQVSPITSDEKVADPIVIHPDVPDDELVTDGLQVQADASESELDVEALAEAPMAEPEPQVEPEPELPAVVGGIDPDEVAQREAEHFAKGLAQAREEHALALTQAVEAAKAEALAQGIEQGKAEGREESRDEAIAEGKAEGMAEGLQQGLEQGREEGKAEGLAEGEQKIRAELADEMAAQRVLFENVSNALNDLLKDPTKFFEPLKRLSLHIAEQVMVGELQTSSQAIERLVQRCLDELDHPAQGAVVVELSPEDKVRLQTHSADFIKGMRLEAVHEMKPGSVRVFANDTVVEDLVEHRLEAMARALLIDEKEWLAKSVLTKSPAVAVEKESEIAAEIETDKEEEEDDDVHS